jgi:hypothetical protein
MNSADQCRDEPRPTSARDPIACLSFAVDAMREAFDLLLAVVPVEHEAPDVRVWYIDSAFRRVIHAARVVRALAGESTDERIIAVADRLDVERRAVLARAREIIGPEVTITDAPTSRCA